MAPHAREDEIKRAYRQLAVLLHPDKNPLPEAEAAFKEINEAYEVLSDPVARNLYNQMLTQTVVEQTAQPTHRDPAYRKRQEAGYTPQRPVISERVLFMQHSLPILNKLSWLSMAWCMMLWIDYFLPPTVREERVVAYTDQLIQRTRRHQDFQLVTDKGHHFPISVVEVVYFPSGSTVNIRSSFFLSVLINLESTHTGYVLSNLATVYRNFSFAPILLFVLSLLSLVWKNGLEFRFNLGIVTFLMLGLNALFLIISIV